MGEVGGGLVVADELCSDGDIVPGVAAPMNGRYEVQACGTCEVFADDYAAAAALAAVIPGATVALGSLDDVPGHYGDDDRMAAFLVDEYHRPIDLRPWLEWIEAGLPGDAARGVVFDPGCSAPVREVVRALLLGAA